MDCAQIATFGYTYKTGIPLLLIPRRRFIASIICVRGMPTLPTLHKTPGNIISLNSSSPQDPELRNSPNYNRPYLAESRAFIMPSTRLARSAHSDASGEMCGTPTTCRYELCTTCNMHDCRRAVIAENQYIPIHVLISIL